jgi:hypothetical protein
MRNSTVGLNLISITLTSIRQPANVRNDLVGTGCLSGQLRDNYRYTRVVAVHRWTSTSGIFWTAG